MPTSAFWKYPLQIFPSCYGKYVAEKPIIIETIVEEEPNITVTINKTINNVKGIHKVLKKIVAEYKGVFPGLFDNNKSDPNNEDEDTMMASIMMMTLSLKRGGDCHPSRSNQNEKEF